MIWPAAHKGFARVARFIEFFGDEGPLRKSLDNIKTQLKDFGSALTAVGAKTAAAGGLITAPFLAAAKTFADSGAQLANMSARTGASVEALSALGFAAGQTGADLDTVEIALKKMSKTVVMAAGGSEQAMLGLARLGLSAQAIGRLRPEDQFGVIARRLNLLRNPTLKAATALEIFGKSGTSILPLARNIDTLTQQAKDFGLVVSTKDAEAGRELGNAFNLLSKVFSSVVKSLGSALAPLLLDVSVSLARCAKSVKDFIRANGPLIVTAFKVGAVLVGVGTALLTLGTAFTAVGTVIGTLVTAAGLFGTVLAPVASVLGAMLAPIPLLVAGLAGLTAWFIKSGAAADALGLIADVFKGLKDAAGGAFSAVKSVVGSVLDAIGGGLAKLPGIATAGFGAIVGYSKDVGQALAFVEKKLFGLVDVLRFDFTAASASLSAFGGIVKAAFAVLARAGAPELRVIGKLLTSIGTIGTDTFGGLGKLFGTLGGTARAGLGSILDWAGRVFGGLGGLVSGAMGRIQATIGGVASGIGSAFSGIGSAITGAFSGAIASVSTWFSNLATAGGQAVAFLGKAFGELKVEATQAFQGIADALKAGNISLAAKVLWATLKLEWAKGISFLNTAWVGWSTAAVETFRGVTFQLASLMTDVWASIRTTWAKALADLQTSWGSLFERLIKTLVPFADAIATIFGVDIQKKIDDALATVGVGAGGEAAAKAKEQATAGIESERKATQQALADQQRAESEARQKAAHDALAGPAADVAKARAELDALTGKAAGEAGKVKPLAGLAKPDFTPEGIDQGMQQAQKTIEAKGGFGASALRGLGVGDTAADQLKEAKKTNDKLDKIHEDVAHGGAVFGA